MASHPAAELARQLAARAEDACRRYLSNGVRTGRYWQVGDVHNSKGRSLYVRLSGPLAGPGAAGRWTDSATLEHGDLLDLIRLRCGCRSIPEAMAEARRFLGAAPSSWSPRETERSDRPSSIVRARRLFALGQPIAGTLADTYLRVRGIMRVQSAALRFHPGVYIRTADRAPLQRLPAMLAAITDTAGRITGVHRTWLAADGRGLARLPSPRRSLGLLLGQGVRFAARKPGAADRLIVGEGIETVLSVQSALPDWPAVAALSANHLAAFIPPLGLRVLAIAVDDDAAGWQAAGRLRERIQPLDITVIDLVPALDDFNDDLREFGPAALRRRILRQFGRL